jgi:class 3 adenylate cyclase/tetratricopeptide (TPR) repeat protein
MIAPTGRAVAEPRNHASESTSGERRQLTVVYCDMVGSTALSHELDPEDLSIVLGVYRRECSKVVESFGGAVIQFYGDGVLAYFCYPHAHEDDAERAVRASLDIHTRLSGLTIPTNREPVRVRARIGIATGLVITGNQIGEGAFRENLAIGETPNLAARLQALAPPDGTVIASGTERLVAGLFELEPLGTVDVKGLPQRIRAWRVIASLTGQTRFQAKHPDTESPFIGRQEELKLLLDDWHQATLGHGRVVLVAGEAGIGKSALTEALRSHIGAAATQTLLFQCAELQVSSTLRPFLNQLVHAAQIEPGEPPEHKLRKLEGLLADSSVNSRESVALLAALLLIPLDDSYPPLALSPQQQRDRTIAAVRDHVSSAHARGPALIIFEDAHWIDPTSDELLQDIVRAADSVPLLLVVTTRPGRDLPWSTQPHVRALKVTRFGQSDARRLVEATAGKEALAQGVIQAIIARAEGVPLFLEELTRTLAHQDPEFSARQEASDLPSTLQDSLMARLDSLGSAKLTAQVAAVIGREFPRSLLARVMERSEPETSDDLLALAESQIVASVGRSDETYQFRHTLLQDAAYGSLLRSRRTELHGRVATVLEHEMPAQLQAEPELLAHHYTHARMYEPALRYWARAGQQALDRSASHEAVAHLRRGLELLSQTPPSRDRMWTELRFQIMSGAAHRGPKGFTAAEAEECFEQARRLCKELGPAATRQHIDAIRGLYASLYARGALAKARSLAESAVLLAAEHDPGSLVVGHYMLGAMMFWQGEFVHARTELEKGLAVYDPNAIHPQSLSAQIDPGAFLVIHLAWTRWILGYPDQARSAAEQSVAWARRLRQPFTLGMALFWAASTHVSCGDLEKSTAIINELAELSAEHSLAYLGVCAIVLESHVDVARGEFARGLANLQRALAGLQSQGAGLGQSFALAAAITALTRLGQYAQASACLERAFQAVTERGERFWEAELHRLKGELLEAQGAAPELVEGCLQQAMAVAAAQRAKSFELRAAISLAAFWRDRGELARAEGLLSRVYAWFDEGSDTADLMSARAQLHAIAAARGTDARR